MLSVLVWNVDYNCLSTVNSSFILSFGVITVLFVRVVFVHHNHKTKLPFVFVFNLLFFYHNKGKASNWKMDSILLDLR